MGENYNCRTLVISDDPSDKDEFGDSHNRIAQTIANLMHTETGGKSIGLEGEWGTGKSTIIKLLSNALNTKKSEKEFLLFLFDAWAHESDPLRRTFLEQLLTKLKERGWITQDSWWNKWGEKYKELIGRKTLTETETSPRITNFGLWVIVATFFIPIGLAYLNNALRNGENLNIFAGYPIGWHFIIGIILSLLPLFVVGFKKLYASVKKQDAGMTDLAILVQKYDTKTTTFTTKTPDPTSIEFENFFQELITDALKNGNRNLVLVLDNLDRISPSDALIILSTLQTFLQCETKLGENIKKLWVLLPYDRIGLERLWQSSDQKETSVASSMIDKRFQVRFRVPPLVLSNWEKYFFSQLAIAFPDHDENEFYPTYRIYYHYVNKSKKGKNPTPREIKLFVNQIGTLHRQWEDKFPLAHMAYFITLLSTKEYIPDKLLKGNNHESEIQLNLGENFIENLAAMWFNTEASLAIQLLLESPIQNAIVERNVETLTELAERHGVSFWTIFDKLPLPQWANDEPRNLVNTAYFLEVWKSQKCEVINLITPFINRLIRSSNVVQKWEPLNQLLVEGLTSLFRLNTNPNDIYNIIKKIIDSEFQDIPKNTFQEIDESTLNKIRERVASLLSCLLKLIITSEELGVRFSEKIKIDLNPYQKIEICAYLSSDEYLLTQKLLDFSVDAQEVQKAFSLILENSLYSERHVHAIKVLLKEIPAISIENLANLMTTELQNPSAKKITEYLETLWILDNYSESDHSFSFINQIQAGTILHHLYSKNQEGDYRACAWCIFILLKHFPDYHQSSDFGNSMHGQEIIKNLLLFEDTKFDQRIVNHFCDIIKKYQEIDFIISIYEQNTLLVKTILSGLIEEDNIEGNFPHAMLKENWQIIKDIVGVENFEKLIQKSIGKRETLLEFQSEFSIRRAGLYYSILSSIALINYETDFPNWLIRQLKTISKQEWVIALTSENELIDLLMTLLDQGKSINLELSFADAFVNHCELFINNETKPQKFQSKWAHLLNCVTDNNIYKNLEKRIIDTLINNSSNIPVEFFDVFSNTISNPELLLENKYVINKLFSPLIENKNPSGLKWFANLLSQHPSLFTMEGNADIEVLKIRIRDSLNQENQTEIQDYLEIIAKLLGVEKPIINH